MKKLSEITEKEVRRAARAAKIKPETLCKYATESSSSFQRLCDGRMSEHRMMGLRRYVKEFRICRGLK